MKTQSTCMGLSRIFLFAIALLILPASGFSQWQDYRNRLNDPTVPDFVKEMCAEKADVQKVDQLYEAYYEEVIKPLEIAHKANPETADKKFKNTYQHLYKVWKIQTPMYTTADGFVDYSEEADLERMNIKNRLHPKKATDSPENNVGWTPVGPMEVVHGDNGTPISWQTNVFCIARSPLLSGFLYVGTESGGVFRSDNNGSSWYQVATDQPFSHVSAIAYWPHNYSYVRVATPGKIHYSDDGGVTWTQCVINSSGMSSNFQTYDIIFSSADQSPIAYAITSEGLLKSADYGKSWTRDALIADNGTRVTSLVEKPGSPETIYMLLYEPNTKMTTLVRSDNYGQSWYYLINSGWFTIPSEDAGKIDVWGGRLAVTPADPNRIYMVLNGFSQPDANLQLDGFIGIYQSNDGGFNWARKTGPIGRPYDVNTKPNLMSFTWPPYEYNQVDYLNNAIAVSTLDPNHLYVGSLAMWESTNGGTSWTVRGGYGGNVPYIHPDIRRMQFRKTSSTTEELYWVSDGGVNFSPDGQLANHEARNNGLFSNHFWGFDSDFREQLMGGGSYHNGNNFYSGAYPNGSWKHAGGAESATGYMQYGENHRAWFTEYSIYAQNVAPGINQTNSAYPTILDQGAWRPNQPRGYEYSRASRVLFDRKNPHVIYWGALGKFCKSTDDGQTATVLFNFGDENMVQWMEQSVEDPNVIYIQVEETATNQFKLYRTANGGKDWSLAAGPNTSNMHFATLGDSYIYRADQNGPNGQKVFYSTNGGVSWNNITTPTLDGLTIRAVMCMENVVNDFFIATNGGGVFNYNYYTQDWDNISEGLNPGSNPVRLAVNYKTQKLQLATRGMGVWERDFVSNPVSLGIKVASDYAGKMCAGEAVHFFYRGQSSANATYSWTFPGGTPGTSSAENPTVSYAEGGTYPVMLTVTDNTYGLSQSVSLTEYVTIVSTSALPYAETFESGDFHPDWQFEDLNENGNTWKLENGVGGFGNSQVTMFNDNYNTNEQGTRNIAQTIKVDLSTATQASLNFDLAYTGYSGDPTFRDSLEVMCSVDCGKTFTRVFFDGGEGLHTTAPISGSFTPTADQWETKTVDLANFLGNDEVLFAFHNIGYYGNNMYIDNINVQGTVVSSEEAAVAQSLLVYPNPSDGNFKIRFDFSESVDGLVRLIDPLGRVVYESSIQSNGGIYEQQVNVPDLSTGLYLLSIKSPNVDISHKIYVQK